MEYIIVHTKDGVYATTKFTNLKDLFEYVDINMLCKEDVLYMGEYKPLEY